ncbi:hypothetical protein [Nocardia huaxiensis]|uniref:Uncharacterized protein n=1 Tax=Nocardia huaxiensis TaxID=2755382 RepID=A0A7D6Z7E1_9NOCA|nr:hypothetical protein [Nocardia huaxiensis]QLY33584.1 hypothetical protein H0264_16305 [Nocardia huaxiensis]UFS99499.1 hypothetical protein LPY97_17215 [Nocardia huaxiensis]
MSIMWAQWVVAVVVVAVRILLAPGWITIIAVWLVVPFPVLLSPLVIAGYLAPPGMVPWLVAADVLVILSALTVVDGDDNDAIIPLARLVGREHGPESLVGPVGTFGLLCLLGYLVLGGGMVIVLATR